MDSYKAWLKDAGVDLPERRLDRLAGKVARELEARVGNYITDHLSDEQLKEFDEVMADAARRQFEWLHKHYPDYKEVVSREEKKLKDELSTAKNPAILIKRWHQAKS